MPRGRPTKPGSELHELRKIHELLERMSGKIDHLHAHMLHVEHEVEEIEDPSRINLEAKLVKGVVQ